MNEDRDQETAEEMLARLNREADEELDIEGDRQRRERDNAVMMDEGVEAFTSLAGGIPVDAATMQGFGPGGPFLIDVPVFERTGDTDSGVLSRRIVRYPLGAFVFTALMHTTEIISKINPTVFMVALAWSFQAGCDNPDMAKLAGKWDAMVPPWSEIVVDGQVHRISRPPITPDTVLGEFGAVLQKMTPEETEALYEIVFMALGRFNPGISLGDVRNNFDLSMLVKTLAKILAINPRMQDRFFE